MATRTSIELHADGCRIVEVHVASASRGADVRVRTAVAHAADGSEASTVTDALARLRRDRRLARHAWVTIWGLRCTHQLLRLPPAADEALEALAIREARKDIAPLETGGEGVTVSVVPGAEVQVGNHRRREVSLIAASSADVRDQIQPIVDAGFVVDGVGTPAAALLALARARTDAVPGATAAYVAVGARATCVAIVRDGLLLFAREMAWGHATLAPGEAIDARMASELKRSILYFKQTFRAPVESLVLCGDLPNIRSVTAPLGEALGVAVETLDSLTGIDAAALPEPSDVFRAEAAALRVAIAAGAQADPPANLLPRAIRAARETRTALARIAATLFVSLAATGGWLYTVSASAAAVRTEVAALERQLALVEPALARQTRRRDDAVLASNQQAALAAFDAQGPRMARFLEAIADAAPEPVSLTGISAEAEPGRWRITVSGIAVTSDAAAGQAAVAAFLEAMSSSPYAGTAIGSPSFRIVSGSADAGAQTSAVPAGMSGVEFTARFGVTR